MSDAGFTHRLTNQTKIATVSEPAQVRALLDSGWLDDPLWVLRFLHEAAHAEANETPVGWAIGAAEAALASQLFDLLENKSSADDVFDRFVSLRLVSDLLGPWFEAIALLSEWDIDLAGAPHSTPHRWLAEMVGDSTASGDLVWRSRLSASGLAKREVMMWLRGSDRGGHITGLLLARSLQVLADGDRSRVIPLVMGDLMCDLAVAGAILDLTVAGTTVDAVGTRSRLIEAVAGAMQRVADAARGDLDTRYPEETERGIDAFSARATSIRDGLVDGAPTAPPRGLDLDLPGMSKYVALQAFALRRIFLVASADVDLVVRGRSMCCVIGEDELLEWPGITPDVDRRGRIEFYFCKECGPTRRGLRVIASDGTVVHEESDDRHLQHAFRDARLSSAVIEGGHDAAEMLFSASRPATPVGRTIANKSVSLLVEHVTGMDVDIDAVDAAAVLPPELVERLATLCVENAANDSPLGHGLLVDWPGDREDELIHLREVMSRGGLPLATVTKAHRFVLMW